MENLKQKESILHIKISILQSFKLFKTKKSNIEKKSQQLSQYQTY